MTRFSLRLISLITLGCLGLVLLALVVGRILPAEDEIVFSGNLDQRDYEIYRMALGRQLGVRLTHNQANNTNPDWSPDGHQIVFVSDQSGSNILYVMNDEGGNVHVLTDPLDGNQDNPMWSPDGQSIAYIFIQRANHFVYNPQLMLFDLRTQTNRYLTNNIDNVLAPYWSPDSTQIAYIRASPANFTYDIYSLAVQTGVTLPLTDTPRNEFSPAWSPDGRMIAHEEDSPSGIYLLDIGDQKSTLLYGPTNNSTINNWSPDGRYILYTGFAANRLSHIYKLNVHDCLQASEDCAPQLLFP
ncbi:MAG: hypothetical protein ABI970_19515, partial [Chloroflexota bacterium]